MSAAAERDTRRLLINVGGAELEVFRSAPDSAAGTADATDAPLICAAHPADAFGPATVGLLNAASARPVVCVNPAGIGGSTGGFRASLEQIVDDIEQVRLRLGARRWVFWGMSGGGWLGQIYAHRYPDALAGLIVESACACFRARVADPACALSPNFPAWRPALAAAGLLSDDAHAQPLGSAATAATAAAATATMEWIDGAGVGAVFRRSGGGPALLVSPMALAAPMRAMMPAFWGFDARPWIASVAVPTLVMCGTADPVVPVAHARAVHEAIRDSTFVAIPGAGHVPTGESRPEVASAVHAFLRDRVRG